ncbi:MAG TPA: RNase adapter RapZ [Lachnospiraceae bacterium]|nr:RNase adapter RapZ [Lachnospiraceae bacterium]
MRFVIVTGMSGSGKTQALKMLEDMGYFCVDNLPLELVGKFAELASNPAQEYSKVALGLDVRSMYKGGNSALGFLSIMKEYPHETIFLDCSTEQLVRRYKTTRRLHPLSQGGRIQDGIAAERSYLMPLREAADYVIDTSSLLTRDLLGELSRLFSEEAQEGTVFLSILSFGYKYGIPSDADLVFDVRFLPNPFYVDALKHKTGNDLEVQQYVCQNPDAGCFLEKITDLLEYLIPKYRAEGKRQLMVCVGCTGGKHRSVTMANKLGDYFAKSPWPASVLHRDITRQ